MRDNPDAKDVGRLTGRVAFDDVTFSYDYSRARATYVYEVGVVTDRTLRGAAARAFRWR